MKLLMPVAASALALTAAACQAPTNTAVYTGRLDCPLNTGEMTRVSAAADGKSCVYREADGADITLRLVTLSGGVEATLEALQKQLRTEAGAPAQPSATPPEPVEPPETPENPAEAEAQADAARTAADAARVSADAARDAAMRAHVSATGAEIKAKLDAHGVRTGEDSTHVDLPGVHISTDGDQADVQVGPIKVKADDSGTNLTSLRDVRMRGEALSRQKRGVRATFVYTGENLTGGYKFVGYEASGLKTGPIVVAIVKAKSDAAKDHSDIYDDVKKLVRRNGGA